MILRSERFFRLENLHGKVADPVGFAVGTARALERFDPRPSTLLLAEWTARLGQTLFFPPNVGGWPGGRAWLSGRAVVGRANYAAALALGKLNASAPPPDLAGLSARLAPDATGAARLAPFAPLLTGRALEPATTAALWQAAGAESVNPAVALLLARPEAQLV